MIKMIDDARKTARATGQALNRALPGDKRLI
jgi:hypothetical protein